MNATNVLVVDESKSIVKLVVKLLLQNGISGYHFDEDHIITASDGMEAFETLSSFPDISLIISEVNMPMLNGDELLDILVDTDKIANIEMIFITDKVTAEKLSPISKKNILGTIHKPFNKETFFSKFNDILDQKQKHLDDLIIIQKENHVKQELLVSVIGEYLMKEHKVAVDEKFLIGLLQEQFDYDTRILDEELLSLLPVVVEEYFVLHEMDSTVANKSLEHIFLAKRHPQKIFEIEEPFKLRQNFETNLQHVSSHLSSLEVIDAKEALKMTFKEMEADISNILMKVKHFQKLPYPLFQPNFKLVIDTLSVYDGEYNDYTLQEKIAQFKELIFFHKWMKDFYQGSTLFEKVPQLKSSNILVTESNKKLQMLFKYISACILHYTGAIEDLIWRRAKASAHIMKFYRENLPGKIPNTKNLLIHLNKLSKAQIKEYEEYEHENVIIISNFLGTLQEVKNKQEANFPLWQMFGFSKAPLLESWLASNEATKIILDYDFSTPVFNNGLQYLQYLKKQFPEITPLLKGDRLFILSSNAKVEEISQHKDEMDFVLITKPLKASEIQTSLMYS